MNAFTRLSATLLTLSAAGLSTAAEPLDDLRPLRWQHRIILVDNTDSTRPAEQQLQKQSAELTDRDVLWFVFGPDDVQTNYRGPTGDKLLSSARRYYGLSDSRVVLVGKDGGVKTRQDQLQLGSLFDDIDRMPMRRAEQVR